MIEGGSPNEMVFNGEREHGECSTEGSRGGCEEGKMVRVKPQMQ